MERVPRFKEAVIDLVFTTVKTALATGVMVAGTYFLLSKILPSSDKEDKAAESLVLQSLEKRGKKLAQRLNSYERMIATEIVDPDDIEANFEAIGGLNEIKEALREMLLLPMNHPELFEGRPSRLLQSPKGILLYGPPGTGKTMLAKAIAKEGQLTFINIRLSTINNMLHGESEKLIKAIFTLACKLQPSVIFLDEMDSFFGNSSQYEHQVYLQMRAEFMSLWDGLLTDDNARIIVVGTTNKPHHLHRAILRRMPRQFLVPLPNFEQRIKILKVILKGEPVEAGIDFKALASKTAGFSGSDLKELCKKAALFPLRDFLRNGNDPSQLQQDKEEEEEESAEEKKKPQLRDISFEDFMEALKEVRPTGEKAMAFRSQDLEEEQNLFFGGGGREGANDGRNVFAELMNNMFGSKRVEEVEREEGEREGGEMRSWEKRFDGREGEAMLKQLCRSYGVPYNADATKEQRRLCLARLWECIHSGVDDPGSSASCSISSSSHSFSSSSSSSSSPSSGVSQPHEEELD
ncbi:mitochondrial dynamin GTPase Msp1 [Balamuthia mandrillaris]